MPPTRGSLGFPTAFSPWQATHFAANTAAPCWGVPLPGGNPAPSGAMLIAQAATSSGVAARPNPGPSARTAADVSISISTAARALRVDMGHRAVVADRPAGDGVAVIDRSPH